jgi:DNA processing protein
MQARVLCGQDVPRRLADMAEPPSEVFLWGELPPEPYVAIVGSRGATDEACRFVRRLAAELSRAGVTVISGGAHGIDASAHEGALDAGARTLVVAPSGFHKPYPEAHRELFRRVVESGGGYLSLSPSEQGARRENFHRRNAVLAALCHALVLGEAHLKSGGRNAVKHARVAGRAVFAVPSAPWNVQGRGSNLELRAGARWLEGSRDVLRFLEESGQVVVQAQSSGGRASRRRPARGGETSPPPGGRQLPLSWSERAEPAAGSDALEAVRRALEGGEAHVDGLCDASGLPARLVQAALFELTLRGVVEQDGRGLLRLRQKRG